MVGLSRFHEGYMKLLSGLEDLEANRCDELMCLWEKHELPSKLRSLKIEWCINLGKLPEGLHRLTCLRELKIYGCPKMLSFPELGFPPMLRNLTISDCEGLGCLPDWMKRDGSNGKGSNDGSNEDKWVSISLFLSRRTDTPNP